VLLVYFRMTKTLLMISHKNDKLNGIEGFVLFWNYLFNCLFTRWKWTCVYIYDFGPWRWSVLNTGLVDKWPSRMQGQWFFRSQAGRHKFLVGSKKYGFLSWGLPMPKSTSPESSLGVGRGVMSTILDDVLKL